MATESFAWQPDWAVAPGEILLEALQERGMSQSELARRMGRPTKTINEIVNGKAAITPETAIQLELTLGIAARFWNNLETTYREHLARERSREELETIAEWAAQFPVKDLVKNKRASGRPKDRLDLLLLEEAAAVAPEATPAASRSQSTRRPRAAPPSRTPGKAARRRPSRA